MPWCLAIREVETGRLRIIEDGETIAADDPKYAEIHVVPFTEEGDEMRFGVHDFTPQCYCRPRFEHEPGEREMVIHEERLPN